MSRRPAAIPAAPAPTTRTSVSLLATGYSAAIWIEPPIVRSQRSPFVRFAPILSPRSRRRQPLFAQTSNARTLPPPLGGGNVLRLETLTNTLRKCVRNWLLRLTILIIAAFVGFAPAGVVLAQPTENTSPEQGVTCPPDVKGEPPTVGGGSSGPLSDKLAQSKGVICPPAGIDRDMQVTPPGGGQLKVIPPPGTPGGDQNVQPK